MGARLAWNNLLSAPVIVTSSSEATGYVDDNLTNPARWRAWMSAKATTDQWVKFDLGSNQSLQFFAAIDPVIHAGGTLRVQANATDSWGAPTINDVLTAPTDDWTRVWSDWRSSVSSLRWVRFYFTNTGSVNAQVSLGAVFAGTYLEPARSIGATLRLAVVDPSITRYAMGGQRSALRKTQFHTVSGRFPVQKASARNDLRRIYASIGSTVPAVLTLNHQDPTLTFYGTLSAQLTAEQMGQVDLWDVPIDFTEDVA